MKASACNSRDWSKTLTAVRVFAAAPCPLYLDLRNAMAIPLSLEFVLYFPSELAVGLLSGARFPKRIGTRIWRAKLATASPAQRGAGVLG